MNEKNGQIKEGRVSSIRNSITVGGGISHGASRTNGAELAVMESGIELVSHAVPVDSYSIRGSIDRTIGIGLRVLHLSANSTQCTVHS